MKAKQEPMGTEHFTCTVQTCSCSSNRLPSACYESAPFGLHQEGGELRTCRTFAEAARLKRPIGRRWPFVLMESKR